MTRTQKSPRKSARKSARSRTLATAVAAASIVGAAGSVPSPAPAPHPAPAFAPMPEYVLRFYEDRSPIRFLWWARSCLKTRAVLREVVMLRLTGEVSRDAIYCTVNEENGRDFLKAVKEELEFVGRVSEVLWDTEEIDGLDVKVGYVEFPPVRGRRPKVKFISSNATAFRGLRGDLIIDEFGFVTDLADVMQAASGCASTGGTLTMMTSGVTEGTVADQVLEMGVRRRDGNPRPGDMPVSLHTVTIDQAIEQGVVEYLCQVTDMRKTREEWRAHCRSMSRTEQAWQEETCCVKKKRSESMYLPPTLTERLQRENDGGVCESGAVLIATVATTVKSLQPTALFAGFDIARKNHLSVVWVWGVCGTLRRTMGVMRMRDVAYHLQHERVASLMRAEFAVGLMVHRLCVDATGLGGQLAEDLEREFYTRVEGVVMTNPVKDTLMSGMRKHAEAETMTLPVSEEIISDLSSIRAEMTAAGHVRYIAEETELGHADHAWAGALGLYAADQPGGVSRFIEVEGGTDY